MANNAEILAALEGMGRDTTTENDDLVPSGQRQCPICQAVMRVENHRTVTVDVCPAHGMWLDNGELMAMLSRAETPAVPSSLISQARRDGKIAGMLLGGWSLLLD